MLQQIGADDLLGGCEVAVGEQRGRGHHLGRELFERCDMGGGGGGVLRVAREAVDALEHAPAHRQGGIDVHRAQERVDRPRRIPERDVAKAALLVQAAEARLQLFQAVQRLKRLRQAHQMPEADGGDQQEIAVLGQAAEQGLGALQGLLVPAVPLQAPQPADLQLDRGRRGEDGGIHGAFGKRTGGRRRPPAQLTVVCDAC